MQGYLEGHKSKGCGVIWCASKTLKSDCYMHKNVASEERIKADHLDNIGNPTHKEKNQAEFIITFNAIFINS